MPSFTHSQHLLKAQGYLEQLMRAEAARLSMAFEAACGTVHRRADIKAVFDMAEGTRHEYLCQLAALVEMDPKKDELDRDELETAFALKSFGSEASRPDLISHDAATYRALVAAE